MPRHPYKAPVVVAPEPPAATSEPDAVLYDAAALGGPDELCAFCGSWTSLRHVLPTDGHVPICSNPCERAWTRIQRERAFFVERIVERIRVEAATVPGSYAARGLMLAARIVEGYALELGTRLDTK